MDSLEIWNKNKYSCIYSKYGVSEVRKKVFRNEWVPYVSSNITINYIQGFWNSVLQNLGFHDNSMGFGRLYRGRKFIWIKPGVSIAIFLRHFGKSIACQLTFKKDYGVYIYNSLHCFLIKGSTFFKKIKTYKTFFCVLKVWKILLNGIDQWEYFRKRCF